MALNDSGLPERFPRRLFTDGMFRVLFLPNMLICVTVAAIWVFMIQWLMWQSMNALGPSAGGILLSVFYWVAEVVVVIFGLGFGSALSLALIRDIANGCDRLRAWPGWAVMNWFLEALYVFNATCVSFLPGIFISWALSKCNVSTVVSWPFGLLIALFLFPVVLMSMLENGSPLGTLSEVTLHTFRVAGKGWLAFYAVSTALWASTAALVLASLLFNDFRVRATIVAVVFAVGWLMYFRMFGKLAGYCAERTKLENAEDDEDEEEFESLKIAEDREPPAVHLS
jgi:hypothetical protein